MAKHYKISQKEGYQSIVTTENSDMEYLNFSIFQSGNLKEFKGNSEREEIAFVITKGALKFFADGKMLGKVRRQDVFEEPPFAMYISPFTDYSLKFEEESTVCCISCKAEKKNKPALITPNDLRTRRVGEETFYRNVTDIISEDFPAERLIVGETINDPGNWSSYPPHKHDKDNPPEEVKMEEIYYFKIVPETGFGVIRVFGDEDDHLFLLNNNEVVTIPKGYHPVGIAPKHQIYYLWALAGENRILRPCTHPDFKF